MGGGFKEVWQSRWRGGRVKKCCHPGGDFFWNNPMLDRVEFEENKVKNFIRKSRLCIYDSKSQSGLFSHCS